MVPGFVRRPASQIASQATGSDIDKQTVAIVLLLVMVFVCNTNIEQTIVYNSVDKQWARSS